MKHLSLAALVTGAICVAGGVAQAQSPDYMIEDCRLASQQFYQEFEARTEATYENQRTDGTHAVNGIIYLETRSANYSCSYDRSGTTLVEFFAEQKYWPEFVRGGGSPYQTGGSGSGSQQTITTERVRFPSGASSFEFPAQLPPRMTVRYELGARDGQFLDVSVSPAGAPLTYRILNPNGTALLDEISIETPYRGQLWQNGDHVVEVINRTGSTVQFDIYFGIE
ncbi:hypothetical protein [Silicimonas sp. MF1-12-2]|uniref:hypothetical protein n=1 Tax=Silicimonas sp. MF1-12-2 TaxID=3384793 RepID=UPI0039B5DCAA